MISGHYGVWNNGTDSVFNLLPTVKTGDRVSVKDDRGVMRTFTVEKTRVYGKDDIAPELFANYGDVRLNLISCYGTWLPQEKTYTERFVVFAKLD